MSVQSPFDAVLLISFGGPEGLNEIRPFLSNVLRGRRVPAERVEDVVRHYELFDGVSPITAITMRQAEGLRRRLASDGLPVFVGMRNWHPFLDETISQMAEEGVQRALAFILAAHHSYSSCGQYKQNVAQAQEFISNKTNTESIQLTYVTGWHTDHSFITASARRAKEALQTLPTEVQADARLLFTAHSIPTSMAANSTYETELRESAALVAQQLNWSNWELVYQSRSGRPQDPWLEPDVCEYLREEFKKKLTAAVLIPIGFVADHVEVLYDLDTEAADVCGELGLPMARAASVNDDPLFLDMIAQVVRQTCQQYANGIPLPIVPSRILDRKELPPIARRSGHQTRRPSLD